MSMERLIRREKIEMLGIDSDDLRLDLHWSIQMVEMLPIGDPFREWHQRRLDYWGEMFRTMREMEKEIGSP